MVVFKLPDVFVCDDRMIYKDIFGGFGFLHWLDGSSLGCWLLARWMKIKNNVFDPDGRSTDDKILLKKIFIKIQLGSIFKVQFTDNGIIKIANTFFLKKLSLFLDS